MFYVGYFRNHVGHQLQFVNERVRLPRNKECCLRAEGTVISYGQWGGAGVGGNGVMWRVSVWFGHHTSLPLASPATAIC